MKFFIEHKNKTGMNAYELDSDSIVQNMQNSLCLVEDAQKSLCLVEDAQKTSGRQVEDAQKSPSPVEDAEIL